jgi:ATP-dependent Clp protease protease subunit
MPVKPKTTVTRKKKEAENNLQNMQLQNIGNSSIRDYGIYYLADEFTTSTARDVVTWIMDSNLQTSKKPPHLTLMISSYGGDLSAAFAIIDVMRGSSIPVHTVGLGVIASAGLLTFISGTKGHRVITPNTSILSHQWSWGQVGKEHELIATMREFELTTTRMINHYRKCTGLTEKVIRERLLPPQDVWLSPEEAKRYKLCDAIVNIR